ncbi:hypothetical protein [Paenibacillus sp. MBLB4367]|uniref:hypothetical protein n=1 Tax=Paenibacillus sp. MBLB4367 TaxID=3384767 RepID=UPI0039081C65
MTLSLAQTAVYGFCLLAIACYALYQTAVLLRKREIPQDQTDALLLKLVNGEPDNDEKITRSI